MRFVAVFVDALDREGWGELGVDIHREVLGAPADHPRAVLSVWLYGFMAGVCSCRKMEAACRDQIHYLWLTSSGGILASIQHRERFDTGQLVCQYLSNSHCLLEMTV